ncbi:MAG: alpha/beta hydrolase [Pseudomonadota bacterium]
MQATQAHWTAADGKRIFYRMWLPEKTPLAWIIINHGMGEHSKRYEDFAEILCHAGFAVTAHDHRGHGETATHPGELGHFARKNGWEKLWQDLEGLIDFLAPKFLSIQKVIFGHSMGSFIALDYSRRHSQNIQGMILSGSSYVPPIESWGLARVAQIERFRQGDTGQSWLINQLTFKTFNRRFSKARTEFDWLSRDPAQVDKYLADPLCGTPCSNQSWFDFANGLKHVFDTLLPSSRALWKHWNKNLPVLCMRGEVDPLSHGRRFKQLLKFLQRRGTMRLQKQTYDNGRHEMLNETNKKEVMNNIVQWIQQEVLKNTVEVNKTI